MGDISTWSPTDESNTMAPPDGWPEGMATNAVNNSARGMMGAVRRWYDTVTAQLASLTSSLAGYLPLSGGTLTGPVSATSYYLNGVGLASRDAVTNFHSIYDADGLDGALHLGGAAAGYQNLYRAETHAFQSNNGGIAFATFDAGGISVGGVGGGSGGISATGSISAGGNITAAGTITGNVVTGNTVNCTGSVTALGSVTGAGLVSSGNLSVAGTATTTGNINCNGAIDCVGNIDAGSYTLNGGPMALLTQAQLVRIEERLVYLEKAYLERVRVREAT